MMVSIDPRSSFPGKSYYCSCHDWKDAAEFGNRGISDLAYAAFSIE
jgi:hypothetical protein